MDGGVSCACEDTGAHETHGVRTELLEGEAGEERDKERKKMDTMATTRHTKKVRRLQVVTEVIHDAEEEDAGMEAMAGSGSMEWSSPSSESESWLWWRRWPRKGARSEGSSLNTRGGRMAPRRTCVQVGARDHGTQQVALVVVVVVVVVVVIVVVLLFSLLFPLSLQLRLFMTPHV